MSDEVAEFELEADRFAGCLVGQALGDAVGFIVEGHPPAVCAAYVESALRPRQFRGLTRGRFSIGQYSDDSQLARELVRSCVERCRFDPEDYARRISTLFTEGRIVGRGRATEEAAYRIAAGTPWEEAGTPAPAAGNGSAMRAAPVGLLFAHDEEALVRTAHDQGRITHQDLRCSAGAIAIAGATAVAVNHLEVDVSYLCRKLSQWTQPFDPLLADAFQEMPRWIHFRDHCIDRRSAGLYRRGMTISRYRLIHDYLWLKRGDEIQRSVGGDYYPRDDRWGKSEFRIPGPTIEHCPDTFAPSNVSDEEWELVTTDLTQELQ